MTRYHIGSDGLIARRSGEYAREKLAFLEAFLPSALTIASSMPDRTYLDLFAGPGLNRTDAGAEFDGSPICALRTVGRGDRGRGFSAAHLVNYRRQDHEALEARVARLVRSGSCSVPPPEVHHHHGDANALLSPLLSRLPKRGYILAFADITGVKHWPWTSVEQLKDQGHGAVDLYALFPLEMTIDRLLGVNRARATIYERHLDGFFGTPEWREHYVERATSAQGAAFRSALIALYRRRLETRWRHVIVACAPGFSEDRALYRMFFATNSDAALRAAQWARDKRPGGQIELGFG